MPSRQLANYQKNSFDEASTAEQPGMLTAFTMCPNWIYDFLLKEESLSVIKVVMYFNRNTTGRTHAGGRRIEVQQASYSQIARGMQMSLRAVGEAIRVALAKGYLIQVKAPRSGSEGQPGEGGWYSLNWNWSDSTSSEDCSQPVKEKLVILPGRDANPASEVVQNLPEGSVNPASEVVQNLPDRVAQNLPPCINKPENKIKQNKESESSANQNYSNAIANLILDLSREFGDKVDLTASNVQRAVNLWNNSDLPEGEFITFVYQAREISRNASVPMRHQRLNITSLNSSASLPNRMPYFFTVLNNLLKKISSKEQSQEQTTIQVSQVAEITSSEKLIRSKNSGKNYRTKVPNKGTISQIRNPGKTPFITSSPCSSVVLDEKEQGQLIQAGASLFAPELTSEPDEEAQILWARVCQALAQRYRNPQLAQKIDSGTLKLDIINKKVCISFEAAPWVTATLLSAERALLQMAISQEIGPGFSLCL